MCGLHRISFCRRERTRKRSKSHERETPIIHRTVMSWLASTDAAPMEASKSAAHLLGIPRELRDEILILVLTDRRPTPHTPSEVEAQDREKPIGSKNVFGASGFYLRDESAYTANATSLLQTNKQLHVETTETLQRLDITTELDVKFVNEQYLAPTWVLIPAPTQHFKCVRAVFQSIGAWKIPAQNGYEKGMPWQTGCGGPPAYVWIFYHTLMYFLEYGLAPPNTMAEPGVFSVEHLELDFIDPEDISLLPDSKEETLWSARCGPTRNRGRERSGPELLRPELLAMDLARQMEIMFMMGYHCAAYAHKFHGRIGLMTFKVNGVVISEIDVAEVLADLKFHEDFGNYQRKDRVKTWIAWKEKAQMLRKRRGLKTVEFKKGWQEEARVTAAQYYGSRGQ